MKKDCNRKECRNCKYFVKHFAKDNTGFYYDVMGCGHCKNSELTFKESDKRIQRNLDCEFWEPIELQIEERKRGIKETLKVMSARLEEIARILKDDN